MRIQPCHLLAREYEPEDFATLEPFRYFDCGNESVSLKLINDNYQIKNSSGNSKKTPLLFFKFLNTLSNYSETPFYLD